MMLPPGGESGRARREPVDWVGFYWIACERIAYGGRKEREEGCQGKGTGRTNHLIDRLVSNEVLSLYLWIRI